MSIRFTFCLIEKPLGKRAVGGSTISLGSLKEAYAKRGISLTIRLGDPAQIFEELGATKVFYNQTFSLFEKKIKQGHPFNGNHLVNILKFFKGLEVQRYEKLL